MPKKNKPNQEKSHLENITNRVGEIAIHYGFVVIKPPQITNADITQSKIFKDFDYYNDVEEKVSITNWYINKKLDSGAQPVAIHYKKPMNGSSLRKKSSEEIYGFEIMGSGKSESEALLLKCTLAILDDLGYKDLYIDINSIGDKESISKFERELGNYHRKQIGNMSAKLREISKKNHHFLLKDVSSENKSLVDNAPQTIASLSDLSRLHFKEVLECLETFDVTYKIKSNILSNKLYASYTVFEIRQSETKDKTFAPTDKLLAYGYRYNHLAKKIGAKRDIPSIGVTIIVKKTPTTTKKIIIKNIKKPRFYLIQLGPSAKLKVLNVVEMLRKNKIPVYHSITKDKITGQLSGAEYMKATHVLVMGQKEALENTIIVRNINNREQETVSLANLPEFLKELDKKK